MVIIAYCQYVGAPILKNGLPMLRIYMEVDCGQIIILKYEYPII